MAGTGNISCENARGVWGVVGIRIARDMNETCFPSDISSKADWVLKSCAVFATGPISSRLAARVVVCPDTRR